MQNKKWLSMLLAVLVSFGLWVYVVTVENPEDSRTLSNIPVVFTGEDVLREDYEFLITEDNVSTGISLTFTGKLSDLNRLTENKSEIVVNIDVSNIRNPREYPFSFDIYDITLPASVSAQNLSLTDRNPNNVIITVEKLVKRPIQVKVLTEVDIVPGYTSDRLVQNYTEIEIEGPADAVEQVEYAQAILKRENVDQTITSTLSYELIGENGELIDNPEISSEVKEIEVTLPILMYKDVSLEVPVIEGGGATADDAVIEVEPRTVRISGDPAVLETIQNIKLTSVDLASMLTNSESFTKVITIPEGCTNLSGEQEASVSVRIKNKAIRQIRVSKNDFQFVGIPSDLEVDSKTSVLPITIRANTADIDQIVEENIRVVADFSAITLTENTTSMSVPVKIYIDGFEGAGVIGVEEYTIVVDISPVSQEPADSE